MQAPFVLRLSGPDVAPVAGALLLTAVVETPAGGGDLPVIVEVIVPSGVTQTSGAAQQTVTVGGSATSATLALAFQLSGPLAAPIVVRASLSRGDALHAVAERSYPAPANPPSADPTSASPQSLPLPGVPVGTPIETLR